MKRCHYCGGRFGLIRHRHYTLRFCAEKCLEGWKRDQLDKARRERFLQWLDGTHGSAGACFAWGALESSRSV
jgi:hypothetical protein